MRQFQYYFSPVDNTGTDRNSLEQMFIYRYLTCSEYFVFKFSRHRYLKEHSIKNTKIMCLLEYFNPFILSLPLWLKKNEILQEFNILLNRGITIKPLPKR